MKQFLSILLLIGMAQTLEDTSAYELTINKTTKEELALTITNNSEKAFLLYPFHSQQNYIAITNPNGVQYGINATLCMDESEIIKETILPGNSYTIVYNPIEQIFEPRGGYVHQPIWFGQEKGEYTFTWIVNNKYTTSIKVQNK